MLQSMGSQRVGHDWVNKQQIYRYTCRFRYSYIEIFLLDISIYICFPDSSIGKESACNVGDPGFDS